MIHSPKRQRQPSNYTEEQKEEIWLELARQSGNASKASRELKKRNVDIAASTLSAWKQRSPEEFERVRNKEIPAIRARMADRMERLFTDEVELEEKLIKDLNKKRGDLTGHEISTALRNVAVSKSLNVEKSAPIRGDRPVMAEKSDLPQLLEWFSRQGFELKLQAKKDEAPAIEGHAEEVESKP